MSPITFDAEVHLRTLLLGIATGWMAGHFHGLGPEATAAVGGLMGLLYDHIAFLVKDRLKVR